MIGGIFGGKWLFMPGYLAAGMSLLAAFLTFQYLPESLKEAKHGKHWMKWENYRPILVEKISGSMMAITFIGMSAFVMMETMIALFLKDMLGWTMRQTGFFLAYQGAVIILTQGVLVRKLSGKIGEWTMSIGGMVGVAMGMLCMSKTGTWGTMGLLTAAGALNAAGRSFWQPTFSSLLSKHTPADRQGSVFGVYWGVSSMARVVAPIVAGWVYIVSKPGPFAMASGLVMICVIWMLRLKSRVNSVG